MGKRLFRQTVGPQSWRELLADPDLHWKRGASAMELAASWELASRTERGVPEAVARVLDKHESTRDGQLIFGFPEHRVALPGGSRASQTDLWVVLKTTGGLASVAVEGKAREAFGPTIVEWIRAASDGKKVRLQALCQTLGLPAQDASDLRYQLLHRAASAVMEASRIGARTAVLLVQNFYPETAAWPDFQKFSRLFEADACRDGICEATCPTVDRLLLAWVDCAMASDAELAALV
jgi:hypothetical protein